MEKIDFKISLLFAPLAYAIHHIEEHVLFNFREWRLTYFPNNNPLSTEAVLSILMAITFLYIIYHHAASNKASAEGIIFFLMATQVHNVLFHLGGSLFTQSYSPGTITALILYIPVNYLIIRNAFHEKFLNKKSCLILFISGGLAFWLNEFFGIIYFIIGLIISWIWIILAPKLSTR
jgi:hypothetical protein